MARLIDADNLKIPSDAPYKASVKRVVAQQPTVEAAPVVHGEWVAQDEGLTKFMCSVCKGKNHGGHEKFCPECGADMQKFCGVNAE